MDTYPYFYTIQCLILIFYPELGDMKISISNPKPQTQSPDPPYASGLLRPPSGS